MLPALGKRLITFYFLAFVLISNMTLFHCQINLDSDKRCPKISQYQVLPKYLQGYFTDISSVIFKRVALFAFNDLIQLMSPEAVHVLVYCGIIAMYGYLIMFVWGCIYFPYALARALLRYGIILIVVLALLGLLSGFTGGFDGLGEAI